MKRHDLNFLEFLQSFRRGDLLHQGNEQLNRVIEAMAETGGDGELTIKLPFKFNKGGQIECTPRISAKVPQKAMGTGIYFASDEGRLSRRDPNQLDIEDEIERHKAAE